MKKKIVWVVVSCLMVVALVLASCGPAVTEEEEVTPTEEEVTPTKEEVTPTEEEVTPTEEEVVTEEEVPRYGGWLNISQATADWGVDDRYVSRPYNATLKLTNEPLVQNDWARGPAGTGERDYLNTALLPGMIGTMIESWEFPDPDTIILHVKKGEDAVHWALNPDSEASRLCGGRAVVAEDIADSITRMFTIPTAWGYLQYRSWWEPGGSATATDNYTVVIKGHDIPGSTGATWEMISGWITMQPYDVVDKYGDLRDWRNSVGTGPFMLTDYVPGSYATFVRNPNYWQTDPCGPGKGNQLPYVDGVNLLTLLDASTRIAALRTAKIDFMGGGFGFSGIAAEDALPLIKANPELQYVRILTTGQSQMWFKVDEKPFDDIKVRQALHMAVDYQAIIDYYYGGDAELIACPSAPIAGLMDAYTPLEELPESTRELYEYNPEKAEQLLDEAGYPGPNRLTFSCLCYAEESIDLLSIIKNDLAKIGVTLNLDVKQKAVFDTMRTARSFKGAVITGEDVFSTPFKPMMVKCGTAKNASGFCDQYVEDLYNAQWAFENIGKDDVRMAAKKAIHEYVLAQALFIETCAPYAYKLWWPWVKNYYGVAGVGYFGTNDNVKFIWIDQDLKKEITGK
jgi:ABC-type transport system substrate-binding protein